MYNPISIMKAPKPGVFTTIGAMIAIITLSLFIIGCPEDGTAGPSAPPPPTKITSPTATVITADGSTTLAWTDPTDTTNAAMIVITGSPAPTTEVAVAIGTQTAVISGLTAPGSDHVFTISTQDSSGTTASSGVDVTASSAVNRPVALFRLDGTTHDGDFGFAACQTDLDDTDSGNNSNDAITTALRAAGYTKAVFFGAQTTSGSEYLFRNLATDDDALGFSGSTPTDTQLEARGVIVYASATPTETFGSPTAMSRTIGSVINVPDSGVWANGGYDVVGSLNAGDFWSFANLVSIDATKSCSGATANTSVFGIFGTSVTVNGDSNAGFVGVGGCNSALSVICAAH